MFLTLRLPCPKCTLRVFVSWLIDRHLPDSHRRVSREGRGRTVDECKLRPERSDNHWLDGLVGCAVARSMQGTVLFGTDVKPIEMRKRVSCAELQRRKRE